MAKWQNDLMLDAAFDWIRARITAMSVCSTQPTTVTEANTTSNYMLAKQAMTSTDLTVADHGTSGRQVTVAAKSGLSVIGTGTAAHIVLYGTTGAGALLLITTCTTQALTEGNTVNVPSWIDWIDDVA